MRVALHVLTGDELEWEPWIEGTEEEIRAFVTDSKLHGYDYIVKFPDEPGRVETGVEFMKR